MPKKQCWESQAERQRNADSPSAKPRPCQGRTSPPDAFCSVRPSHPPPMIHAVFFARAPYIGSSGMNVRVWRRRASISSTRTASHADALTAAGIRQRTFVVGLCGEKRAMRRVSPLSQDLSVCRGVGDVSKPPGDEGRRGGDRPGWHHVRVHGRRHGSCRVRVPGSCCCHGCRAHGGREQTGNRR